MKIRVLAVISFALTLAGCASGSQFTALMEPREDMALLYVIRPDSPPILLKPTIVINGIQTADLSNKGYFVLALKPGNYTIEADWSWHSLVRDRQLTFLAETGRTYYVFVAANMMITGAGPAIAPPFLSPRIEFESGMDLVSNEFAIKVLAECAVVEKYQDMDALIVPK